MKIILTTLILLSLSSCCWWSTKPTPTTTTIKPVLLGCPLTRADLTLGQEIWNNRISMFRCRGRKKNDLFRLVIFYEIVACCGGFFWYLCLKSLVLGKKLYHSESNMTDNEERQIMQRAINSSPQSGNRLFLQDVRRRWPHSDIPYSVSCDFSQTSRAFIAFSLDEIEKVSCVKFTPAMNTDSDYINIYTGSNISQSYLYFSFENYWHHRCS